MEITCSYDTKKEGAGCTINVTIVADLYSYYSEPMYDADNADAAIVYLGATTEDLTEGTDYYIMVEDDDDELVDGSLTLW